jgi:hypothetical protein
MADISVERDQKRALKTETISDATSGDNTIVALVTGKRIKVYAIVLIVEGTVNITFKSGASTSLTGQMNFQAREGFTLAVAPPAFLLQTAAGEAFVMNLSAAIQVDGWIAYWDDDI